MNEESVLVPIRVGGEHDHAEFDHAEAQPPLRESRAGNDACPPLEITR